MCTLRALSPQTSTCWGLTEVQLRAGLAPDWDSRSWPASFHDRPRALLQHRGLDELLLRLPKLKVSRLGRIQISGFLGIVFAHVSKSPICMIWIMCKGQRSMNFVPQADLVPHLSSDPWVLCDLGQVMQPLWAVKGSGSISLTCWLGGLAETMCQMLNIDLSE